MYIQLLAAAAFSLTQPAADRCATITLPASAICLSTPAGIVVAADRAQATELATWAVAAEQRFARYFGTPPRYAILLGRSLAEAVPAVRTAGYDIVLNWPTDAESNAARERAIRAAMEQRFRQDGVPEAEIAARVDGAIRNATASAAVSGNVDVVPHELGHQLFVRLFWPDFEGRGGHYGGPAPDWLDEAAAVMMETDATAAQKRTTFRQIWDADPSVRSLARFVEQDHPMRGQVPTGPSGATSVTSTRTVPADTIVAADPQAGGGGATAIAVSTRTNLQVGGRPLSPAARFYTGSRAIADFLVERSGNPRILGELARGIAAGQSFAQWLAANGPRYRLGTSPEALQTDWEQWVARIPLPPASQPAG